MKLTVEYIDTEQKALLNTSEVTIGWTEIQRLCEESTNGDSVITYDSVLMPWWRFIALRSDLRFLFVKHKVELAISDKAKELLESSISHEQNYSSISRIKLPSNEEISLKLTQKGFSRILKEQQLRNVSRLYVLNSGATFSVPGAGKTTEALAYYILTKAPNSKLLVIAPKNAFMAWDDEIKECVGDDKKITRLIGGYRNIEAALARSPEYCIITYQQFPNVTDLIAKYLIENEVFLFLDESHKIKKGASGAIGSAILELSHLAKRKLIMSGTPMPNRIDDLVPQFRFLYPEIYVDADSVADKLQPVYVRTTKRELNLDNNRRFIVHLVSMYPNQRKLYDLLRSEQARMANRYLKSRDRNILRSIGKSVLRMIQITSNPRLLSNSEFAYHDILNDVILEGDSPKIEYVCRRARELASQGKKTVIWSSFVSNVELIAERLSDLNAEYIHGQVDSGDENDIDSREYKIRRFHNDPNCFALVANPAAAGEGISLHKVCHHAIYLDRNYNAAQFLQSIDRIHRLGLAPGIVSEIEIVLCKDSIDELVQNRLETKINRMEIVLNDNSIQKEYEYYDEELEDSLENSEMDEQINDDDIIDYINHLIKDGE